jgi:uncharacterized membrane protein HdeD (DUF308 family)
MWRVFGGAALVIAGIAAFIEAHTHRPVAAFNPTPVVTRELERVEVGSGLARPASGLSQTAYGLLRIGAWALVIVGALLIVVGLIGYWRAPTHSAGTAEDLK